MAKVKNFPRVRCTKCNEQILRNRELVVNKRTICLGCAVDMGLTQKLDIDMEHKLSCYKGGGLGDDESVIIVGCKLGQA